MTNSSVPFYGYTGVKRVPGPINTPKDTVSNSLVRYNEKHGTDDKDYRSKIAKRANATNAYVHYGNSNYRSGFAYTSTLYLYTVGANTSWYDYRCSSYLAPPSNPYGWGSLPPDSVIRASKDIALKRIKSRIQDDVKQFQSLVPLGELRELRGTLRGITGVTENLLTSLVSLKRGNIKEAYKRASDLWLTYSFGVSPMISDAQSLAEAIAASLERSKTARYTGSHELKWTLPVQSLKSDSDNFGHHRYDMGWQCEYSVKYIAATNLLVASSNNYGISDQFGLSLGNVLPALWELTIGSWVVDYFTTAGAYFEDVFSTNPVNTLYLMSCERFRAKLYSNYSFEWAPLTSTAPRRSSYSSSTKPESEYYMFKRTPLNQLPKRSLRFKTADEIGANAVKRVLNLASLLGSRIKP